MGLLDKLKRIILSPFLKVKKSKQQDGEEKILAQNDETLIEHLSDLRKQLIKSVLVFLLFLVLVFSTMNVWFPHATRGHELVVFGPFQIVKLYTSISVTLALGLSLPFLIYFLWQFV